MSLIIIIPPPKNDFEAKMLLSMQAAQELHANTKAILMAQAQGRFTKTEAEILAIAAAPQQRTENSEP
jgi:hypothetical protein